MKITKSELVFVGRKFIVGLAYIPAAVSTPIQGYEKIYKLNVANSRLQEVASENRRAELQRKMQECRGEIRRIAKKDKEQQELLHNWNSSCRLLDDIVNKSVEKIIDKHTKTATA